MSTTPLLQKAATLASISLQKDETESLKGDLERIFSFLEDLKSAPTDGVSPLVTPVVGAQTLTKDTPQSDLSQTDVLSSAPLKEKDLFLVPRFID